jgi:hypothetical protein
VAVPNPDPKIRQNLALVLAVQGKHAEARAIAGQDLSPEHADANIAFLRKLVKADAAPQPAPAVATATAAPTAAPAAFITDPGVVVTPAPAAKPAGKTKPKAKAADGSAPPPLRAAQD